MVVRILPLVAAVLLAVLPSAAHAQLRARLLASGFNRPNAVVFDPVVPGAIYVVDQGGLVRTFLNGVERPTPFLDLRAVVSGGNDERGLLGLAFPPDASTSGRVFVNFTNRTGAGNTVVARFRRSSGDPLVVDPASRFDLQFPNGSGGRQGFITQPFSNHNGGNLVFGPDGYLYIGMGDGGSANDPGHRAQSPDTLLGKMLRIDVAVADSDPVGYAVPPTNPTFPTMTPALGEIWAFGLRNPWRYSFDDLGPGATNALIIGDVGQNAREEIDYEPAGQGGRNYGWRVAEGGLDGDTSLPPAYFPLKAPTFEYPHGATANAITGGYVYRGSALGAAYQGRYFYADCPTGTIYSLQFTIDGMGEATAGSNTDHTAEMGGPFQCIGSFARAPNGELFFLDFGYSASNTGRVFVIERATATAPGAPTGLSASVTGSSVSITWTPPATGGAATGYLLEAGTAQGATNIGTFPTSAPGLAVAGVPTGQYFVRVRATNAVGTSAPSSDITINVGCSPPAAPSTFTASAANRTVTMTWNVAGGTTTTVIDAGYAPGTTALSIPVAAPASGVAFPGVPPGTYYVRTRALNACGTSTPSVERTLVVQ
jgi:glucose/arabinose dehydrogenase